MGKNIHLTMQGIHLKESRHTEKNTVDLHYHEESYQILYAMEDKGDITINGHNHSFNKDHVAVITPYSAHAITASNKLTVLVLEFSGDMIDTGIRHQIMQQYFEQSRLIALNLFEAGELRLLLRKMLYEQSFGETINDLAMKIYLAELLLILARSQGEPEILDANVLRADRLRRYIDTHYFEMMTAADISSKLGISSRHVNTIFKAQYNMTPLQYLNVVRIEKAKKLWLETDQDIISICFEVGFESLSTFYRIFKSETGISPKKFRSFNMHASRPINKMLD